MLRRALPRLLRLRTSAQCRGKPLFHSLVRLDAAVYDREYTKLLYTRLAADSNYQYLDPDLTAEPDPAATDPRASRLIQCLQVSEENSQTLQAIEDEALQSFKEWARSAQLRVGFVLHLTTQLESKEYLNKLIQHMTAGNLRDLAPHDVVTLLLLIYFRRDFTVEEISEYLDPDELQVIFATNIEGLRLNSAEVCAGCLGLKKIQKLKVQQKILRSSLYSAFDIADQDLKFKDFYMMTILTTLSKDGLVYNDSQHQITKALKLFLRDCDSVSPKTAVKMMTFGINSGYELTALTERVCHSVVKSTDQLSISDLCAIANFFSRSADVNSELLYSIKGKISNCLDSATSVANIADILKCLSYLCICEVYRLEAIQPVLQAFATVSPSDVQPNRMADLAEQLVRSLAVGHENADQIIADLNSLKTQPRLVQTLCRIPAFLCFNLRLDNVELDHGMSMDTAAAILALFQKKLPLQLHAPQMGQMDRLEKRSRQLVYCYRAMCKIMGRLEYVGVSRLLPQFTEPDIVFGNIGGIPVTIPDYLTDASILRPKRAPVGDWWVLIMANKKNLNLDDEIVGLDQIKVRQLTRLGFNPIVVPSSTITSPESIVNTLIRVLRLANVSLPNLDEGYMENNKKF